MVAKHLLFRLILSGTFVLTAFFGHAQSSGHGLVLGPPPHDCAQWRSVPGDLKGTRRWIYPYPLGEENGSKERAGTADLPASDGGGTFESHGVFRFRKPMYIGMLSEPDDEVLTLTFVTRSNALVDFYPDATPKVPIGLGRGALSVFAPGTIESLSPAVSAIPCQQGDAADHLENVPKSSDMSSVGEIINTPATEPAIDLPNSSGSPLRPPAGIADEAKLGDLFTKGSIGAARGLDQGEIRRESPTKVGGLAAVMGGEPTSRKLDLKPGPPASPLDIRPPVTLGGPPSPEGGKQASLAQVMTFGARESSGTDASGVGTSPSLICDPRSGDIISIDVKLASLQAVAVRNGNLAIAGFQYIASSGDAIPVKQLVDVSETAKKVVPYEAVAPAHNGLSSGPWVSIPGVEKARTALVESSPSTRARSLRVVVASGPSELAMSGLEQLDAQLRIGGGDRIGLDIEWQVIDQSGAVHFGGEYFSFNDLVQAAALKARDRLDALGEIELFTLFDALENVLMHRAVDKLIWIKGAYSIPSSIPPRFERFISEVSSSGNVPHAPSGQPAKWLQIITAQMPGFSLAYLKEPVTLHQIGDLLEESPGSVIGTSRRLITANDAVVLGARLRAGLTLKSYENKRSGLDPSPDPTAALGKLVFDARDVFAERGYIISLQTARSLQEYLRRVRAVWEGNTLNTTALAEFANASAKPRLSIADLLEAAEGKPLPRLPRTLPAWMRQPLADLTKDENSAAIAFVSAYRSGVDDFVAGIIKANWSGECSLFYVSEASLGFENF